MTSAEEWREIERIFSVAVDLAAEEQAAYLNEVCRDRDHLRSKVERLLVASRHDGDVIEEAVGRAAVEGAVGPWEPSGGRERIGPYRVGALIGEGGMGAVYLGERDDGNYRQKVAIKVVKEGPRNRSLDRRFRVERQILAQLDHPAIARLLDGGTTPDGRPYLVMEYVEGEAIDTFCDRRRLPIRARLVLFRKLCEAVADAHSRLVVHRDIKPANVLITPAGEPKLLDFGISKLLDDTNRDPAVTTVGERVLTPAYASPEQLRGEPITTAVDVYSLGVLLYRLLVGRSPYPVADARGESLRRAICEGEVVPASRAVVHQVEESAVSVMAAARSSTPDRLRKQLRGDLDHIVAKALRKRPNDRYASVEQLAADIGRQLEGRPVEARRGGWRYHAVRFVIRHRVAVLSTVGAVVVAMLALSLGLVGQMREAERADREAAASAKVVEFLVELFSAADPYKTRDVVTAREILDLGVARIERELAGRPLVQAQLMSTMGLVYQNRGLFEEAEPLRRGALARWSEGPAPDRLRLASAHLDLADNLRVLGRVEEALPHYEQALDLRRAHAGAASAEVAEARNNLALALIRQADYSAAEDHLLGALEIRRGLPDLDYPVAQSLHNLVLIALRQGDYRAAVERGRETLELKARSLAADHPSTGRTMLLLGRALQRLGRFAEAEERFVAALAILRPAFGDRHVDVLGAEGEWADVRHLRGEDDAEERQRAVLARKREHLGDDHPQVVSSLYGLAVILRDRGDLSAAEPLLREALASVLVRHDDEHPRIARVRSALGDVMRRAGRLDEAEPLLRAALDVRRRRLPAGHPDLGQSAVELAALWVDRGRCDEARPLAGDGLAILRDRLPPTHARVGRAQRVVDACR